jgi:hypothetical protein
MRRTALIFAALLMATALTLLFGEPKPNPRLKNSGREPERNGWIPVHLEGTPAEIGFQHGYLLAPEIQDNFTDISTELVRGEHKDWAFFRNTAREIYWPRVEKEYREELQGIADGLKAQGVKLDLWDVVAINGWMETPYYIKWLEHRPGPTADHCSAFVATGSYTKDGRFVIGHNDWTTYSSGERWNVIFDVAPVAGHHFVMDGMPGLIHSGDDFGLNSAGLVITETTISEFSGFDPQGVPEFVRARKAMQYASTIDDFARIMKDGNNGGYANNWLVADRKTNEIASLELGLKNVILQRTKDGYFVGSNFPADPKLIQEETGFDPDNLSLSANARHKRWLTLMANNKGKIDIAAGERFLADHFDSYENKEDADERSLCGHVDLSPRGLPAWQGPYSPAGAVQNKVTDAANTEKMTLFAALGHSCGIDFKAAPLLAAHPELAWYKPILRDMNARPWTEFRAK